MSHKGTPKSAAFCEGKTVRNVVILPNKIQFCFTDDTVFQVSCGPTYDGKGLHFVFNPDFYYTGTNAS